MRAKGLAARREAQSLRTVNLSIISPFTTLKQAGLVHVI
jgi:hypothetical protein